ncbi:hypothetical protein FA13DRAFT_1324357 [Coprinellus micaceus]|uniref:Uncharacterized protein n=1 Tax=Coprinellus micaceus TaxID=71717 RepID=A0A4Y7SRD4_COPMI|nr:hypothetical protein FA13DRAFT_1324357 [Coprinellus micaceus]
MRCEEVTQLLLQGLKGEELTQALRELEKRRHVQPPSALPLGLEHQAPQQQHHLYAGEPGVYGQDTLAYEGAYAQDHPYAQHDGGYGAQQEAFGAGSYVDYSRGATPSTASSIPFSAMSAPQPTYPAPLSTFGLAPTNGGGGQQALFMQRRPSSVPAIPTSFGMGWGADFVMQDDSAIPAYGSGFHHQQQQQQATSANTSDGQGQGQGIEIPSVPFLPPPSSAGPVPMISGFLASSTSDVYGHRMSLSQRMALGHRRSSSAGAAFGGMRGQGWGMWGSSGAGMGMGEGGQEEGGFSWPPPQEIQRDETELPEADLSLFNPSFLSTGALGVGQQQQQQEVGPTSGVEQHQHQHQQGGGVVGMGGQGEQGQTPSPQHPFTTNELYQHLPPQHQHQQHQGGMELGPLDSIAPNVSVHPHSHSSHPSLENANALQFQAGVNVGPIETQMQQGGQQGQREPSPVEQYEQMYLAEQGQYGVYPGGEYDMAAYGVGVQYSGVSV